MSNEKQKVEFELFYVEQSASTFRFALRLSGNREDAEDLVVSAFGKAYAGWSKYRRASQDRTWIFAIVLNEWKAMRRKRKQVLVSLDSVSEVAHTLRTEDYALAQAMLELSDEHREAFLLVKGEGLSHEEASKIARVPVGTMHSRVHHAIRRLRELMSDSPNSSINEEPTRSTL